jgi:hypothetical protein
LVLGRGLKPSGGLDDQTKPPINPSAARATESVIPFSRTLPDHILTEKINVGNK